MWETINKWCANLQGQTPNKELFGSGSLTGTRGRREPLLLTGVLLGAVLLLFCLMFAAIQITSGVRAYTSGEAMWSKAQKDATFYLMQYSVTSDVEDWDEYRHHIAVPLADRRARLALEDDRLDSETQERIAFAGYLAGGNDPKDIPMMIFLFRWFAWQPQFAKAIDIWREADQHILAIERVAAEMREEWQSGSPDEERLQDLRQRLHNLDYDLRPLEDAFSRVLGDAARWVQNALLLTMIGTSILLVLVGVWLNRLITEERFDAEARLRATFEQASVGMAHVSLDGRWLEVNDRLCEILGYERSALLQRSVKDVTHPDDREKHQRDLEVMRRDGHGEITIEKRYVCADGRTIWANVNVAAVRDSHRRLLYFAAVIDDITESRRLSEQLSHQATHDALTGLINRYEFERRMQQAIDRSRVEGVENALCFLDLDQFKIVNDTCGHVAGDALLKQVSTILRRCIRSNDTLARLGGDEFALLLEACPAESARAVAEKVRLAIHDFQFTWEEQQFNLGASVGVVPFNADDKDINSIMSAADTACYAAKEAGRNRVHVAEEDDEEINRHMRAMRWQQGLREALAQERFFLVWQPIHAVGADRQQPSRFEVLLRLRDENGDVVPPGEFLPAAERFGMIRRMDRWVLNEAMRWLGEDEARQHRVTSLSVNLSGLTFSEAGFADFVLETLEKFDVPPSRLCLEITETATITNMKAAREMIGTLQACGCRFALDDFGMGFASFAYLNSFPVDLVKIDGTFVRDMDTNSVHLAMVRSINDIAHAMGKETVAEFVENERIWKLLEELGVDYGQGFGIGRPQPLGEFAPHIGA